MLPTCSFLTVNSISEGQVFLDFYHQELLFYDFVRIDSVFYDLHMEIDNDGDHKTRILIIARVCNLFTSMVELLDLYNNPS